MSCEKLEKLLNEYKEWKNIFGHSVPTGHRESKDQARERKRFENDIAVLKKQAVSGTPVP